MNFSREHEQILNIRKPIGWTSNDVVRLVKRRSDGKVGHAGTLDPFADGVLLVCLGPATKKASELMLLDKQYRAVVEFSAETDTLDIAGNIINQSSIKVDIKAIQKVLPEFIGQISQTPPIYSALKVNGQRAYNLARAGKDVKMEKRKVMIYSIDIINFNQQKLEIDITCAKGVYIRSLARDIAHQCGSVGFLRKLTRTRIGHYSIEDALSVAQTN